MSSLGLRFYVCELGIVFVCLCEYMLFVQCTCLLPRMEGGRMSDGLFIPLHVFL